MLGVSAIARVGVMVGISVMVTGISGLGIGLVLGVPPACLSTQHAREPSPLSDIYQRNYRQG